MQEVPIPNGKELRFRCGVPGCHVPAKSYSMVTIYDHLARHYARHTMSNDHFNFRCRKCGVYYYHYGLTISCACTERGGTENECVQLGTGYSRALAHRHNDFYGYLKLHSVPVFDTKESSRRNRSTLLSTPERAEGDGTPRRSSTVRSPTWRSRQAELLERSPPRPPTTPKVTRRPVPPLLPSRPQPCSSRSSCGSTSHTPNFYASNNSERLENRPLLQSPVESSPYSSSEMRRGNEFGSTTTIRPPCPPTPGPAPVAYPPPLPTPAGFPPMTFPCGPYQSYSLPFFMGGPAGQFYDPMQLWPPGVLPFTTMPNPQTPHADRSAPSTTSTAQLNPTSTPARRPPERKGGTKFLETPPHTTPMKPEVLTPRRKRRSSRREDSDSY